MGLRSPQEGPRLERTEAEHLFARPCPGFSVLYAPCPAASQKLLYIGIGVYTFNKANFAESNVFMKKITPAKPRTLSATRHRGVVPSAALIPMQFKMPPDFVKAFKVQAATNGMKLNELLKACFTAFMKESQ